MPTRKEVVTETTHAAETQEGTEGKAQEATGETTERSEEVSQEEETRASQEEASDDMVPKSELTKKNKEAESLRKRLRTFEKEKEEERKKKLSETESLQEENGTLKEQLESLQKQVRRANFERQLNLPDADLAWGMLQDLGLEVSWSDSNTASNIDEIRKVLKKEKPRIWGSGSANGGERNQPPPPSGSSFVDGLFRQGRTETRR